MQPLTENKIVLVTRRTRLDELIVRFNTVDQARFYVEHMGIDFQDYILEDQKYKSDVKIVEQILFGLGRLQVLDRNFVPNFIFGPKDLVVVLGQDGLVANTLKYLNGQSVIGVNPDPERWDGVLLPFESKDLKMVISEVFQNKRHYKTITMAMAQLNTGEKLYGVNDIFIGPRSHTSARYQISVNGKTENQSSSGIIISTGLGSTGWLKSVLVGAAEVVKGFTGNDSLIKKENAFDWSSDFLYYSVREPWPGKYSSANIAFGKINRSSPLEVISQMPENGIIFSDGIEADFLKFNSGSRVKITPAEKSGRLII